MSSNKDVLLFKLHDVGCELAELSTKKEINRRQLDDIVKSIFECVDECNKEREV